MHEPQLSIVDPTTRTLTTLATRFEALFPSSVSRLFVDESGGVVVEGRFDRIEGIRRPGLARFKPDRSLDLAFDPITVTPLFILPDGRIIGSQTTLGAPDAEGFHALNSRVVRLTLTGTVDPTFTPPENLDLFGASWLTVDTAGRILVAAFMGGTGDEHLKLLWLAPDGSIASTLSTTFTRPAWATTAYGVESAAALPDGKLLLRVVATTINGAAPTLLVRLNADGTTDTTYHPNAAFGELRDITTARPLPDGRGYVYGPPPSTNGAPVQAVLQLNPDGSPDTFVQTAPIGAIALSDGTYIFENKRYRSDGSQDLNFDLQLGATQHVRSALLAPDGSLWIAGDFGSIMGERRFGLARLVANEIAGFTLQPTSQRVTSGQDVTFQAEIGTTTPATFQWTHDGVPVLGATGRTLTLARAHSSDAGDYRLIVTVGGQTYTSEPATLLVDPSGARLVNFSARSAVAPQRPPQIGGFVLSGPNPRAILLRAVGSGLPVDNPGFELLPRPGLTLFRDTSPMASDDGGALASAIVTEGNRLGAAPLRATGPSGEAARDAALLLTLEPGIYTAQTHSIDAAEASACSSSTTPLPGRSRPRSSICRFAVGPRRPRMC